MCVCVCVCVYPGGLMLSTNRSCVLHRLQENATQITYHGICELQRMVAEGEVCTFFRNNHFSTLIKKNGQLCVLATDQGAVGAVCDGCVCVSSDLLGV